MAKDKKGKKAKAEKKAGVGKAGSSLESLAQNPLLADVVAAALVATASALKDSKRARALAADAADELGKLSREGAERGSALWDMALEIGKRSLDALSKEVASKSTKKKTSTTPAKKPEKKKRRTANAA